MTSELELKFLEIKRLSKSINGLNSTRKTTGGKYPLKVGYSTYVKRPIRDILKWMAGVEELLEVLVEEAGA